MVIHYPSHYPAYRTKYWSANATLTHINAISKYYYSCYQTVHEPAELSYHKYISARSCSVYRDSMTPFHIRHLPSSTVDKKLRRRWIPETSYLHTWAGITPDGY